MKNLVFVLLAIITLSSYKIAGNDPYAQWDKKVLEKANTAKDITTISDEEKKVIFLVNLARINPSLFETTILNFYVDSINYKNNSALASLRKTLNGLKPMTVLTFQEDLQKIAEEYAIAAGKSGKKGHEDAEERFKPVMKKYGKIVAENGTYGHNNAMRIAMQMLIDELDGKYNNRTNILNPLMRNIGLSIKEHRVAKWHCIVTLAGEQVQAKK